MATEIISTQYLALDELLNGGFQCNSHININGIAGSGKTILVSNLIHNFMKQGHNILSFSNDKNHWYYYQNIGINIESKLVKSSYIKLFNRIIGKKNKPYGYFQSVSKQRMEDYDYDTDAIEKYSKNFSIHFGIIIIDNFDFTNLYMIKLLEDLRKKYLVITITQTSLQPIGLSSYEIVNIDDDKYHNISDIIINVIDKENYEIIRNRWGKNDTFKLTYNRKSRTLNDKKWKVIKFYLKKIISRMKKKHSSTESLAVPIG